jgi:RNA polymerase sigma-70 factor (ECF subfamily)
MLRNARRRRGGDDNDDETAQDPLGALLSRAGRGDQSAFADLYDSLAPLLHGIVLKVVRDPAQSEEVTQEAFIELWRLAPRYDATRGSVKSWAATLAHRRAIDRVRSEQASRERTEREGHKRPIQSTDVAEQVVANIDGTRVRKALERLTEIQRQAVELAYFGGHSYREVALLLDVAEGTIKTRIRDGMIRLRDELGVAT